MNDNISDTYVNIHNDQTRAHYSYYSATYETHGKN